MHHALYVAMPGQGRTRGQPDGRDHRQPEREERRKRGPSDRHGYDAGKQIKGKKRHVLVDTQGLLMLAVVDTADIQDRKRSGGGSPAFCWTVSRSGRSGRLAPQALHSVFLVGDDLSGNGRRGSKRRCVMEANTASAVSAGASSRQTMPPSSPA